MININHYHQLGSITVKNNGYHMLPCFIVTGSPHKKKNGGVHLDDAARNAPNTTSHDHMP